MPTPLPELMNVLFVEHDGIQILHQAVKKRLGGTSDPAVDPGAQLNYVALSTETEGYMPTDLKDLVGRAMHQATIRCMGQKEESHKTNQVGIHFAGGSRPGSLSTIFEQICLTPVDFRAAQVDFTPLSLRDVPLQKSTVEWADIGGELS